MTQLGDYLAGAARKPFVWGAHDCSLWVADWVALRAGYDPAEPYRGRYTTARGCARLITRAGGLVALWGRALAALQSIQCAEPGDVGIVHLRRGDRLSHAGAICTGPERWAAFTEVGLSVGTATAVAAWRP